MTLYNLIKKRCYDFYDYYDREERNRFLNSIVDFKIIHDMKIYRDKNADFDKNNADTINTYLNWYGIRLNHNYLFLYETREERMKFIIKFLSRVDNDTQQKLIKRTCQKALSIDMLNIVCKNEISNKTLLK